MRWFLSAGLIVLGSIYLNSAFFSTWAAGDSLTRRPHAWEQRALLHCGYSVGLIATGIMALIGLKTNYNWRKSKYKYIWLILLLLSLGYPKAREWILIDKCLDSGGQWDIEYFECRK
jgi:hypothetical protein